MAIPTQSQWLCIVCGTFSAEAELACVNTACRLTRIVVGVSFSPSTRTRRERTGACSLAEVADTPKTPPPELCFRQKNAARHASGSSPRFLENDLDQLALPQRSTMDSSLQPTHCRLLTSVAESCEVQLREKDCQSPAVVRPQSRPVIDEEGNLSLVDLQELERYLCASPEMNEDLTGKRSSYSSPTVANNESLLSFVDCEDILTDLLMESPVSVRASFDATGARPEPFASTKRLKTTSKVVSRSKVAGLPADWEREDRISPAGKAHLVICAPGGAVYPSIARARAAAARNLAV